jgi:uncharacterized protein (DUF2141 family)
MTNTRHLAFVFGSILFSSSCLAALPALTVVVSGLEPATGIVEVSLFDSADKWRKEPYLQQKGPTLDSGTFETTFAALPEGEYAVIVVHDANGNEKLDRGFLGLFGESYGFSGDAGGWFFQPSFDRAKFEFRNDKTIEIQLD